MNKFPFKIFKQNVNFNENQKYLSSILQVVKIFVYKKATTLVVDRNNVHIDTSPVEYKLTGKTEFKIKKRFCLLSKLVLTF